MPQHFSFPAALPALLAEHQYLFILTFYASFSAFYLWSKAVRSARREGHTRAHIVHLDKVRIVVKEDMAFIPYPVPGDLDSHII